MLFFVGVESDGGPAGQRSEERFLGRGVRSTDTDGVGPGDPEKTGGGRPSMLFNFNWLSYYYSRNGRNLWIQQMLFWWQTLFFCCILLPVNKRYRSPSPRLCPCPPWPFLQQFQPWHAWQLTCTSRRPPGPSPRLPSSPFNSFPASSTSTYLHFHGHPLCLRLLLVFYIFKHDVPLVFLSSSSPLFRTVEAAFRAPRIFESLLPVSVVLFFVFASFDALLCPLRF